MIAEFADTLDAARAGEEWAVAVLWRELNPPLLRFLRARDRLAADDVASETWLRVARDLRSFRGADEVALRAWFFAVARHALIDSQRRARRRPESACDEDGLRAHEATDDPAAEAIEGLDTDRVLTLVGRLPADQGEIVLLRVVAGLDAARVGEIVGKRAGTVRVLQHRGLRRLAALLEADARQGEDVTR